jgi:hypothetical protein
MDDKLLAIRDEFHESSWNKMLAYLQNRLDRQWLPEKLIFNIKRDIQEIKKRIQEA